MNKPTGECLQEMASAITSLTEHAFNVTIINDNYDEGIPNTLLIKAKRVHNRTEAT